MLFRSINSGTFEHIRTVAWADDNTAHIAGDNGLLCISRDGGLTWEPLSTGTKSNFGTIAISGGRGYVFGSGGVGFAFTVPVQVPNIPPRRRHQHPDQHAAVLRVPPHSGDGHGDRPGWDGGQGRVLSRPVQAGGVHQAAPRRT